MRTEVALTLAVMCIWTGSYAVPVPPHFDGDAGTSANQVDNLKSKLLKLKNLESGRPINMSTGPSYGGFLASVGSSITGGSGNACNGCSGVARALNRAIELEELQGEENLSRNQPNKEKPDLDQMTDVTSDLDQNEPISGYNDDDTVPIVAMKKLISQFSPRDIVKLKALKQLLDSANEEQSLIGHQQMVEDRSRYDPRTRDGVAEAVPANDNTDDMTRSKVNWREVARELQSDRDQFYLARRNKGHSDPQPIRTHTEEGTFGEFRDEIKTAVEKNLLQDVSLAIHSGIPVQEILKDLAEHDLPDMSD